MVAVGHHLPSLGQPSHRLPLPHGFVAVDVVEDAGLKDEEGAVDPLIDMLGLLIETRDAVAVDGEVAEPAGLPDSGDRGKLAVGAVEGQEALEIDIRKPVAPCQHESLVSHEGSQTLDAATRHGCWSRV